MRAGSQTGFASNHLRCRMAHVAQKKFLSSGTRSVHVALYANHFAVFDGFNILIPSVFVLKRAVIRAAIVVANVCFHHLVLVSRSVFGRLPPRACHRFSHDPQVAHVGDVHHVEVAWVNLDCVGIAIAAFALNAL